MVLWPDNDDPGREHMERLADSLYKVGVTPRSFEWEAAPSKGDAADFRGSTDDLIRMLSEAPRWSPKTSKIIPVAAGIRFSDVPIEQVQWLWKGRIPLGKLTILEGDPDEGKSLIMLDLAARLTTGRPMPFDDTPPLLAGAVYLSGEDGIADTLRPRLVAAGGDSERVWGFRLEELPEIGSRDHDGLAQIEAAVQAVDARLVVIDPLTAFLADRVETHKDHDVRRALRPLAALAERLVVAVVVIRHLNKSGSANAKQRGGGSIGLTAAARSVLLAGPDPDDPSQKVLARVKNNLAAEGPALAYKLEPHEDTARIEWVGETRHTANALLAAVAESHPPGRLEAAREFLRSFLANGRRGAMEVLAQGKKVGINSKALHDALRTLGSKPEKVGRRWVWDMPRRPTPEDSQECQAAEGGNLGNLGDLDPEPTDRRVA